MERVRNRARAREPNDFNQIKRGACCCHHLLNTKPLSQSDGGTHVCPPAVSRASSYAVNGHARWRGPAHQRVEPQVGRDVEGELTSAAHPPHVPRAALCRTTPSPELDHDRETRRMHPPPRKLWFCRFVGVVHEANADANPLTGVPHGHLRRDPPPVFTPIGLACFLGGLFSKRR